MDENGRLTQEGGTVLNLQGTKVFDANKGIVDFLAGGLLLNKPGETVRHSYPHCWRCHNPIIFRATE